MSARYREIPPSPRIASFVQSFWTLDHDERDAAPPQRVVPDGHPELILNFDEPFEHLDSGRWHRQPRYFFAGQIRGPLLLRASRRACILGVRFTPNGAAALLDAPMHELSGRFTPV